MRVSLHVPAYNEPPEVVRATLRYLEDLDYPNFEVLVIDNNTRDERLWKPVQASRRTCISRAGPAWRLPSGCPRPWCSACPATTRRAARRGSGVVMLGSARGWRRRIGDPAALAPCP